MVIRALVIAAALAGCIEPPPLVRCGELACPTATSCVAGRCVTADQLASCAGLADDAVCSIDNAVGACHVGICDPVGCGNARVDADEVCDDGNTTFGDGCSGDCRSLETCGNGIVDAVAGETCDCGVDDSARPASCQFANSDALEAECTPACELRYCGNDALDRLEQCDGTDIGTATCSDFGFYAGSLACLGVCRYDTTSCIGRCGDTIVDPAYGEFCDGSAPEGTCITFGYDAGTLACSSTCTPDAGECERFGWQVVDTAAPRSLWARGRDTLMIAADSASAWITIGSLRDVAPAGTYRVATGIPGGDAYAVGDQSVAVWNGSEWSTFAGGWSTTKPTAAWASASLGLYVVVEDGTVWRHHGGTWTSEAVSGVVGVTGDSEAVYVWSSLLVWRSTGTGWTSVTLPVFAGTITAFASSPLTRWLGTRGLDVYRWSEGAWGPPVTAESFTQMVATTDGDLIVGPSLRRHFADDRPSDRLNAPGTVVRLASSSFDDGILATTSTTTYRLRTGSWVPDTWIYDNDYLYDATSFHMGSAGGRTIYSGDTAWYAPAGSFFFDMFYGQPFQFEDFTESIDAQLVFATGDYGELGLWAVMSDGFAELVAPGDFRTVHNARDGAIVGAGSEVIACGGIPTWDAGWVTYGVPGYFVRFADRLSDGSFVAAAQRNSDSKHVLLAVATDGTVSEIAGTERAATSAWADIWLAPDDTLYAVAASTVWIDPPTAAPTTYEITGAVLESVSGTANDDVFVGGSGVSLSGFPGFAHFDGTAWTLVRAYPNTKVRFLFVTDTLIEYVFGRQRMALQRVIRW